eukprot:symbB.v1.2.028161.t1/scaffold2959.1/size66455/3
MFGPRNELLHESWTWCLAAVSGGLALLLLLISCSLAMASHSKLQPVAGFMRSGWQSRNVLARQQFHHVVAMLGFVALPPMLWTLTKLHLGWICIPIGLVLVLGSVGRWCCNCSLFLRSPGERKENLNDTSRWSEGH